MAIFSIAKNTFKETSLTSDQLIVYINNAPKICFGGPGNRTLISGDLVQCPIHLDEATQDSTRGISKRI